MNTDALEQKTRQLTEGELLRPLLRLATPVIVSITLQTLYQLVNAFWLGRLGAVPVAVVSVTTPLTVLLLMIGNGLSIAGSILVAQFSGARNRVMVNRIAAQTMLMIVVLSLVLSVVGIASTRPVLHALGVSPEVLEGAAGYLAISYGGLTASYAFVMCQSILQGAGEVRFPLIVVAASVVLNAILDPILTMQRVAEPGTLRSKLARRTVCRTVVQIVAPGGSSYPWLPTRIPSTHGSLCT